MLEKTKKPKLNNPILIQGLPGIGNVGKIAVDFLAEEMDAKKYCTMFSHDLPHSVFVSEENLVNLPNIEFFYIKNKPRDIVLLKGDTQASSEPGTYRLCSQIIDVAKDLGINEIVTLGGIGHQKRPKEMKLHAVGTETGLLSCLKEKGICIDNSCVSVVIGAAGVLLGLARKNNIRGFSLLVDTYAHPAYLGFDGAKEITKFLSRYLEFDVNLDNMAEVEIIKKPVKEAGEKSKNSMNYIG